MTEIQEIEDFFYALTLQMLELNPNTTANQGRVRIGWPSKGAPAWKRTQDVAFLLITQDDDSITQQVDVEYRAVDDDNAQRVAVYTRVIRVNWVCYGPNCSADADKIRSSLYLPDTVMKLAENNFALILDVPVPFRSPELFNGQWWERANFTARFNFKATTETEVKYIQSADVRVIHD